MGEPTQPGKRLTLIVAMARNRVIGSGNRLPWHLADDLRRFKALTMGHHIIMGRKTWDSIGRALPGRSSIVITRSPQLVLPDGVIRVADLDQALSRTDDDAEVFVIGGADIFRLALPRADRIHLTEVAGEFAGDVYFPEFDTAEWQEVSREPHAAADGAPAFAFVTLERRQR